ncbi:phage/plasmid primase, P4 family [Nocardioides sambongensis]|uniref:phage/plasmid primase, P4 family n=1 Tax=Nocardioides sambongensis TaxID=2589074 RepID=UPI0015E83B16|nr:phage/plasmid primase, P4 family [Nocardioides sambongensis]
MQQLVDTLFDSTAVFFPLPHGSKTPKLKWKEFDAELPASTTTYGVDCGRSNLVVIDLDRHAEGADGVEAWSQLVEDVDDNPPTLVVATPNDGLHRYYRAPEGESLRNSAGRIAPGIDVRAVGGYVVGPHSQVRRADGTMGTYELVEVEPIAELPSWLREAMMKPVEQPATFAPAPDDFPDQYARAALESATLAVMRAPSGQRNDTLNRECFGAAKAGAPAAEVIRMMTGAALSLGLSQDEVDATVTRAVEEGARHYVPRTQNTPATASYASAAVLGAGAGGSKSVGIEHFKDLTMAERFIATRLTTHRYVAERRTWIRYDQSTGAWDVLDPAVMQAEVMAWLREEWEAAARTMDHNITKAAVVCLKKQTVANVCDLAALHVVVASTELDAHSDLLLVANGVVHLPTGTLRPFDPDLLITKRVPSAFTPGKTNWVWSKILEAVPVDVHSWLQLMAGQTLTGEQPASTVCLFLHGGGANAKSSFLDVMEASAGTYGGLPPQSTLMRSTSGGETFNLITFKGLRQALVEELPDERNLDVGSIKRLVGTKKMTARGLREANQTFDVEATLWVSCNRLPNVSETDPGTWRRLLVVPFPYTYKKSAEGCTDPMDRVANPAVRVLASTDPDAAEACLAWRIEGARRWYADKREEVKVPVSVTEASLAWRESADNIIGWFKDSVEADIDSFCLTEDLRDSFNTWARAHGYQQWSHRLFMERLTGHDALRANKMKSARGRTGALTQSQWKDPAKFDSPRRAGESCTHVKGVRFKAKGASAAAHDDLDEDGLRHDADLYADLDDSLADEVF